MMKSSTRMIVIFIFIFVYILSQMIHRIFHPNPALAHIVEHYWYMKVKLDSPVLQYHLTPLLQGLVFNFRKLEEHHSYHGKTLTLSKQAYFFGQTICPRIVETNKEGIDILGVKLHPLGIVRLTGINMEEMSDKIIAAEDIWGNELELLCDEMQSAGEIENSILILENFLLKKHLKTQLNYRIENIDNALSLIESHNGAIEVKTLQNLTNTSRKTLERAFSHYLGLKPKFYTEIVRFNKAKNLIEHPSDLDIADIAYRMGYYDNSHFAAEFKRFSGQSPTEYSKKKKSL